MYIIHSLAKNIFMLLKFMNRFEQSPNSYVQDSEIGLNQNQNSQDSGIDLNQTQNVQNSGINLNQNKNIQDSGVDLNQSQNIQDSGKDLNQNPNLPSYALAVQSTKPKSRKLPKVTPVRSFKPSSMSLYSGARKLRQVIVPNILIGKFLSIAQPNTSSNIETCGFLTGKRIENQFKITHLLIPKQSGTADSCDTNREEIIFDYQEKHGLLTLGWIHTHPSQTAFLSSVDLHTQLAYQLMLPEAIAIVISPKYNETGFFSLTPDHGVDFIANCKENGFHPHPNEPPLFAEIGHMELDLESDVRIVDLRSI